MARSLVSLIVLVMWVPPAPADSPESAADVPAAFRHTWQQTEQNPAEAPKLWRTFADRHRADDLGRLARIMAGIEMLRRDDDANRLVKALAEFAIAEAPPKRKPTNAAADTKPPLSKLGLRLVHVAKVMAAHVRMAILAEKLQQYYRRHIAYPESLDALVSAQLAESADLIDPFGKRFEYATAARTLMPDLARQTYRLQCDSINADHRQLPKLLRRRAAPIRELIFERFDVKRQSVEVRKRQPDGSPGPRYELLIGRSIGKVTLLAVYDQFVIVTRQEMPLVIAKSQTIRDARAEPL